jgi:pyrroloquinoline quinone (PQQ) biosynthesis protein C
MRVPRPRGPISDAVTRALRAGTDVDETFLDVGRLGRGEPSAGGPLEEFVDDDDLQLTLWVLEELHYRGFDDVPGDRELDPGVVGLRQRLRGRFERLLRDELEPVVDEVASGTRRQDVPTLVQKVVDRCEGPALAAYLHRTATREQMLEFLRLRSVYHLKESDPHSFVLARVDGRVKVALAELQYDEYGSGRPDRLHARLFAEALSACGLEASYGAYVDEATARTLAVNNVMSTFALQRRLRGAALGHLAAFETTSSVPCRKIAAGIERLGLPEAAAEYFDEHVEADAVHEQVALRDICGALVREEPDLLGDVLLGVAACIHLDALAADELLARWDAPSATAPRPVDEVAL